MSDPSVRSLKQAGFLLGFALGGFFDSILLHQILQWHNLLTNVDERRLDGSGALVVTNAGWPVGCLS
jgi:uncharacterized membrane protein